MLQLTKECSVCGKKFSLFYKNARDYAYKVRTYRTTNYQCSYSCYVKELNKDGTAKKRIV